MIIRFKDSDGNIQYGVQSEDQVQILSGDIFSNYELTNKKIHINDISILAPTNPSKVVCIGLNYVDHAKEMDLELPKEPLIFIKPSTTVIGTNETIIYPEQTNKVEYEAELAIVIGKKAKNILVENAHDYIFGYTVANDVTARDIQFSDGQWTRGKSFDTFCPIGPGIVKNLDTNALDISLFVNGERKQHSNTSNLIFNVEQIVSYVSHMMTLLPGDIIITGTPYGVGEVNPGDEMVVEIEGIGRLINKIQKSSTSFLKTYS